MYSLQDCRSYLILLYSCLLENRWMVLRPNSLCPKQTAVPKTCRRNGRAWRFILNNGIRPWLFPLPPVACTFISGYICGHLFAVALFALRCWRIVLENVCGGGWMVPTVGLRLHMGGAEPDAWVPDGLISMVVNAALRQLRHGRCAHVC